MHSGDIEKAGERQTAIISSLGLRMKYFDRHR